MSEQSAPEDKPQKKPYSDGILNKVHGRVAGTGCDPKKRLCRSTLRSLPR